MITAIDTNVLFDVLLPNEQFYEASSRWIQESADSGSLVISDIAYAELCIQFETRRDCDSFLDNLDIRVEPLSREASFTASRAWRAYRRQGGRRTRILADFLIGAHAHAHAARLLSRDRGFYRQLFPTLKVIDPSEAASP